MGRVFNAHYALNISSYAQTASERQLHHDGGSVEKSAAKQVARLQEPLWTHAHSRQTESSQEYSALEMCSFLEGQTRQDE